MSSVSAAHEDGDIQRVSSPIDIAAKVKKPSTSSVNNTSGGHSRNAHKCRKPQAALKLKRSGMETMNGEVRNEDCSKVLSNGYEQLTPSETGSDVEERHQVTVNGRRCTSVPAAKSRQGSASVSHKITEYFPVRRSSRMTGSERKKQELNDILDNIRAKKQDGLTVVDIVDKGRGVVATKNFTKGEFVVEYAGELVDLGIAKQREKDYSGNMHVGCYMYYFQHRNKNFCVDATAETGLYGRLVNHSRLKFNCVTKVVEVDDCPRLILVASRDISVDEELLYDYGDRSKESLITYPWLAL